MLKQSNKICCIYFKRPCNKLKMAKRVSSDKTDLLPLKRVYYGQQKNNPKIKDEHKLQTAPETADFSISKYPVPVIENMSSKSQELMQPTESKTLLPLKLDLPCTDKDTVKLPPLKQTESVKNIYKILSDGDQRLQNTSNNSVFESESLSETLCDVTKSSNPVVVTELMPTILCDANKSNNSAIVTESLSATLYDVTKSDSSIFGREATSCDITKITNTVSGIESLSTSCIVTSKEQPKVPGFVLVQLGRTPKPIFGSQLVKGTSESSLQSEQKTDRMKNANYTVKICETSLQMSHVKANLLESETFTNTSESAKDTLLEGNHTSEFVVKTTDTNIKGLETIKETTRNQLCFGVSTIVSEENKVKHETIEAVTEKIDSLSEGAELNILGTSQADTGSTNEKCILTSLAVQMATPDKTKQVVKMPSASIKIRTHTSDAEEIIAIRLPIVEMMTSLNDEKTVTASKTALATVVKDANTGLSVLNEAFEKDKNMMTKEAVLNATEMVTKSSDFTMEMMSSVKAYIHENILADSSCDTLTVYPVSCSFNGKENRCETDPNRGLIKVNDKENKGNNVDPQSQVNINGKDVRCENEQELITVDDQKNGHEYDTANSQRQVNINHKVDICETVMMQGQTEPGLINLVLSTSEEISSDTRITKSSPNAAELASSQQDIFHPAVLEEQHVDAVKTFVHISDELMAPSEICSKNDDQGLIDFCQGNIETCKKEVPVENNSLALIIKDEFLDTKLPNDNDIDSPQNVCMKDMNFSDKRSIRKDENFELGFVEGPEESSIMASCKLLPPKRKLGVLPPVMLTKVVSLVKDNVRTFASEIMSSKNAPASQVKKESAIIDKKAVKSNDGTTSVDTSPVSIQKSDCTSIKNSKKSGKNKKKTEKMKILDDSETEKKKLLQEVLPQYIPESDSRKRKKNKRDRVYNISHIFSENFGQESKKSNRPNFFVAVQITSQKIKDGLSEVQATIEKINKEMKTAFIALDTLHITLMVMHLSDDEAVTRARTALDNSHTQRADRTQEELNFCVKGLGHFRNQVIYAEVEKGPALDRLSAIAETVKTCMNEQNICPFDKSTFTPHITIMKMSKNPKKLKAAGIKKIPEELYNTFKYKEFGCQTLCTIQLCSMMKPKRNKYYHIEYEIPF